jgi:hypothetical protein
MIVLRVYFVQEQEMSEMDLLVLQEKFVNEERVIIQVL